MGEWTRGRRAQSSVIGVVLVLSIVIAGSTLTLALGAEAVSSTQGQLSNERAEQAMTQLDSQAAMVALGSTDRQEVTLPESGAGGYSVDDGAGWMNVSYSNESGATKEIFNERMGAIVYENGQQTVAYQGGGVWRASEGGSSRMVSPPEFHYRDATLTLPLVTVRGTGAVNSRAQITRNQTVQYFPDRARNDEFRNPVAGTAINVTVRSEYYEAWGNYFATRTEGTVTYDHDTNTARITLVPPFDEEFDNVVATTRAGGITVNGNNDPPSPYEEGVNYPAVDSRIEEQIDDCQTGSCDTFDGSITDDGVYYSGSDYSGELDVDDPGGNVTVVVDGSFEINQDVTITDLDSDHSITLYVRNDFTYNEKDAFNSEAEADDLRVLVHSDGEVNGNGNSEFVGLLYAPQSNCDLNGNNDVTGGLICETMDINGNPNTFQYDDSVEGVRLDLSAENITRLQYMHVTTNEINVTGR